MSDILELHITLHQSNPLIRRVVQVKKETSFFELHHIIQITMGWQNYHLFEFNLDGYRIGMVEETEKANGYGSDQVLDAISTTLADIISSEKDTFKYTYDFGDCWLHQVTVEKFLEKQEKVTYPICTDGVLNCPPEDCGGIPGFYNILAIIGDKKHPEYKDTRQWVGKKYDPLIFEKEKINRKLKQLHKHIGKGNPPV